MRKARGQGVTECAVGSRLREGAPNSSRSSACSAIASQADLAPDYNVAPTKRIYAVLTRRSGSSDGAATGSPGSG